MSTPKSISLSNQPKQAMSPYGTISFSHRDSSPRAASLAKLAQSPNTSQYRSGSATPTISRDVQVTPLLKEDFRKIDPKEQGIYSSLNTKPGSSGLSRQDWHREDGDPEIIRKHLVSALDRTSRGNTPPLTPKMAEQNIGPEEQEEFSSLQLLGGDITRQVYRYAEQSAQRNSGLQRSYSFSHLDRSDSREYQGTVQDIIVPGGFRRNFIHRTHTQPASGSELSPTFLTRNFLHFLTLYGHFAGEDLEEWDDVIASGGRFINID